MLDQRGGGGGGGESVTHPPTVHGLAPAAKPLPDKDFMPTLFEHKQTAEKGCTETLEV